jgi:phosphonate degradation associated HDIG domain protein
MNHPLDTIEHITLLLGEAARHQYGGEPVSQLEHALQCAYLAQGDGAPDTLITAALLHDLGHLVHDLGDNPAAQGIDDKHEVRALHTLRRAFGDAILEPIRLHVDAKRYLCAVDERYHDGLSEASRLSLTLQGGRFDQQGARAFITQPYAREAARLRTWDDRAKTPRTPTPALDHFVAIMRRCAK